MYIVYIIYFYNHVNFYIFKFSKYLKDIFYVFFCVFYQYTKKVKVNGEGILKFHQRITVIVYSIPRTVFDGGRLYLPTVTASFGPSGLPTKDETLKTTQNSKN